MLIFVEGRKPENPEKNSQSKDENQLNPHVTSGLGIKLGSQQWEVSAQSPLRIPAPLPPQNLPFLHTVESKPPDNLNQKPFPSPQLNPSILPLISVTINFSIQFLFLLEV